MKPVVVHLVETFLGRSEVFIYNYVSSHVNWDPVVLCKSTDNEREFPVKRVVAIPAPVTKRDPAWWLNEAVGTVTGRSLWHRRVENEIQAISTEALGSDVGKERGQPCPRVGDAAELADKAVRAPVVIHAHFGQMGWLMLPVKRRLGLPLVTTFYGYDMSVLPRLPKWPARLAELFAEADLFLAEGPCMRQRLIELGVPAEKVKIQRIAIHVDRYPAWQPEKSERPVVLFVGRFSEKKGLPAALAAVREVRRRGQPLRFRIVGDGDQRAEVERFVVENQLADCVEFLGMKPHGEVIRELTRAHVFIHPSRTAANGDTEGGAPTILLEAQAVGVPIVTTRHADIPNVVGTGGGVYLSDETDTVQLAENLFQALRSGQGSDPAFVREHHNVAKEVLKLEAHYASVVKRIVT